MYSRNLPARVVITPAQSDTAMLRGWGQHDAARLALAIAWERSTLDDARRELATTLAWHAQRAKIRSVSCRGLAMVMLNEELAALDEQLMAVRSRMIDAAERLLRANPSDRLAAAMAAGDIARTERVPPMLIDAAFAIALWRTQRRA